MVFQSHNYGMVRACGVPFIQVSARSVCAVSGRMCERGGSVCFVSKNLSDWGLGRRSSSKTSRYSVTNGVVRCKVAVAAFFCCLRRVSGSRVQCRGACVRGVAVCVL